MDFRKTKTVPIELNYNTVSLQSGNDTVFRAYIKQKQVHLVYCTYHYRYILFWCTCKVEQMEHLVVQVLLCTYYFAFETYQRFI